MMYHKSVYWFFLLLCVMMIEIFVRVVMLSIIFFSINIGCVGDIHNISKQDTDAVVGQVKQNANVHCDQWRKTKEVTEPMWCNAGLYVKGNFLRMSSDAERYDAARKRLDTVSEMALNFCRLANRIIQDIDFVIFCGINCHLGERRIAERKLAWCRKERNRICSNIQNIYKKYDINDDKQGKCLMYFRTEVEGSNDKEVEDNRRLGIVERYLNIDGFREHLVKYREKHELRVCCQVMISYAEILGEIVSCINTNVQDALKCLERGIADAKNLKFKKKEHFDTLLTSYDSLDHYKTVYQKISQNYIMSYTLLEMS